MSNALKEVMNYMSSGSTKEDDANTEKDRSEASQETCNIMNNKTCKQSGYFTNAVSGVSTGVLSVGTAGFNSVKWIAGTTYSVTSGVVGTAASAAGSVVGAVIKGSPKEHTD